jgi:hypothetical protein
MGEGMNNKILLLLLSMLIILPNVYALSNLEKAQIASDTFVAKHGKFFHKYSFLNEIQIFRRPYSEDSASISFQYVVVSVIDEKIAKASFIVTLNKNDLSIFDVKKIIIPDSEDEIIFYGA